MANSKQDIKDQKEIPKMPKAMRERLELELKNHAKDKAEVQAQQKAAKKKEHTKSNGNNFSSGKDGEPEKKLGKKARKTKNRLERLQWVEEQKRARKMLEAVERADQISVMDRARNLGGNRREDEHEKLPQAPPTATSGRDA